MPDKVVLVFLGTGANSSVGELMSDYGRALQEYGLSVVFVDVQQQAEVQAAFDVMRSGDAAFALTWLGIGQSFSATSQDGARPINVFEASNCPLVKLQGDLPAYFPERHLDIPANSANMYQADEFVTFRKQWLTAADAPTTVIPPMPMVPIERAEIDSGVRKTGELVFLKNGNSPQALRDLWQSQLAPANAGLALAMSDAIIGTGLKPGRLDIGEFVADFLRANCDLLEPPRNLVMFFSAQMDDYMRRIKSTLIAEALLDLPVVVQGSFWSHVDFSGKRARWREGQRADVSQSELANWLGVIDMSANVDTWPHDRVQRAAGAYSLVLTNRQSWLSNRFPEFADLTFEFDADSIRDRVSDAISKPDRYLELGVSFGERFREIHSREAFSRAVVKIAELAGLAGNEQKPVLQNFYVWPPRRK